MIASICVLFLRCNLRIFSLCERLGKNKTLVENNCALSTGQEDFTNVFRFKRMKELGIKHPSSFLYDVAIILKFLLQRLNQLYVHLRE